MPDHRRHRGPHPQDHLLFNAQTLPKLRAAVADYSWLMGRGYASKSALVLVGDHFQLHERQRLCVMRAAASEASLLLRTANRLSAGQLISATLHVDGYNALITLEAALSGGIVLLGRDGCLRDIAALHGTFRRVEETVPALELYGAALTELEISQAVWYFDAPVSNSGRLRALVEEIATTNGWPWRAEIVQNPDTLLKTLAEPVVTADGIILDAGVSWFNLAFHVMERSLPNATPLDFRDVTLP
jgi:hypothetical protein